MTITEIIAAAQAVFSAIKGLTDMVANHEKAITDLQAKVAQHDQQLKPAPLPGSGKY